MKTRAVLVGTLVAAAAFAVVGTGIASANTGERSFPGCSVLSEDLSSGPCVVLLQTDLNLVNSGYNLEADGTFGPATRIAVLDFQGRNGLGADGIVGATTADELDRQAQQNASQPTPQPAPSPSPQERCHTLGDAWITYGADRCIRDGVIGSGLSPVECLQEQLGAKAYEEAVKGGMGEEAARALAAETAGKALEKLSTIKSVLDGAKCMFVTNDPEQLKEYESVPMP